MKIVIDTNVIMAGLIKNSIVRLLLASPKFDFYTPKYALIEIEKYKDTLCEKAELSYSEFDIILNNIMNNIILIADNKIVNHMNEAERIMKNIDIKDSAFIAACFSIKADGLWSFDDDFNKQTSVKIFNLTELLNIIND